VADSPQEDQKLNKKKISSTEEFPRPSDVLSNSEKDDKNGSINKSTVCSGTLNKAIDYLRFAATNASNFTYTAYSQTKNQLKNPIIATNVGIWSILGASIVVYSSYSIKQGGIKLPATLLKYQRVSTSIGIVGFLIFVAGDIICSFKYFDKFHKR